MGSCEVDIQQTKEHDETREENKWRRWCDVRKESEQATSIAEHKSIALAK